MVEAGGVEPPSASPTQLATTRLVRRSGFNLPPAHRTKRAANERLTFSSEPCRMDSVAIPLNDSAIRNADFPGRNLAGV